MKKLIYLFFRKNFVKVQVSYVALNSEEYAESPAYPVSSEITFVKASSLLMK